MFDIDNTHFVKLSIFRDCSPFCLHRNITFIASVQTTLKQSTYLKKHGLKCLLRQGTAAQTKH